MDLNELQSVQSRERQTDSLQQLRATFYRDAADYIADLESERDAAAERADDPWNAPEVGRLNDDIDTAKDTVEAIYERRVGKIVKMASLAAADMPTDDEGLTQEEQALFDRLVDAIERNREGVFAILDGEEPPVDPTDTAATGRTSETDTSTPTTGPPGESAAAPADAPPDTAPSADDATRPTAETGADSPQPPGTGRSDGGDPSDVPQDAAAEAPPDTAGIPDESAGEPAGGPSTGGEAAGRESHDTPDDGGVDAADLMAGGPDDPASDAGPETEPSSQTEDAGPPVRDGGTETATASGSTAPASEGPSSGPPGAPNDDEPGSGPGPDPAPAGTDSAGSGPAGSNSAGSDSPGGAAGESPVDRSMVRITDDVGPIYGVEGREYELTENDVVTLPEPNVGPLLEKGAAKRIE